MGFKLSAKFGTLGLQNANAVVITGGTITGITDLAVADGGTGASDAVTARTNLGLGTIATQAANNVAITGGLITGIADLAVADGGTGTSTGSITGTGVLTFAAGGSNQNVVLAPSGFGYTILGGNVGIGTTSPVSKLDISSGHYNPATGSNVLSLGADVQAETRTNNVRKVAFVSSPHYVNAVSPVGILFQDNDVASNTLFIGGGNGYYSAATYIGFWVTTDNMSVAGVEKLTILGSGKVGIGVTTPVSSLTVKQTSNDVYGGLLILGSDVSVGGGIWRASGATGNLNIRNGGVNSIVVSGDGSGNVGIGASVPSCSLDVNSNKIRVRTAKTPATASDTGDAGDICWDNSYIYICVATNTWKRASISTW